jgi:hypothetical protein
MHKALVDVYVAKVRQRHAEGDCPITERVPHEQLEFALLSLADALAAAPQPGPHPSLRDVTEAEVEASAFADEAWRDLLEKDDRTSPEDYPDMALITHDELASIIFTAAATGRSPSVEPQSDWLAAKLNIARADGWREAVICARQASRDLIPPDREADQVHKFAAETVVRAVEEGARTAGVRFIEALQNSRNDGASAQEPQRLAERVGWREDIIGAAKNLVSLWQSQKIEGLPRSERNAAIEQTREALTRAVLAATITGTTDD